MSTRAQWLAIAGAVALLMAGVLVTLQALAPATSAAAIGEAAPPFQAALVPDSADTARPGVVRSLEDYRGKVVVLNFWATWCQPCKVEMPSMEALHRDFHPRGLRVVAVSQDDPRVTSADLRAYAEDLGLTFEILQDSAHTMTAPYQVIGYPTTFVIARDGTIRRRWVGPEDWNSPANRAFVKQLLGGDSEEGR